MNYIHRTYGVTKTFLGSFSKGSSLSQGGSNCDITQWIPTLFKSRCQVVNRCCQKDSQKEFTEEMKTQSSPEFLYYFVLSKV
ncbi:uncharacterized protein cxcl2.L isoform X2 [Xenopus laevis]|uniref:Uncharacterized protein cxcl2.L isoform X2 n=1 Tax=Xenopus laevis TaxID=8355 RepID=A0A8J1MZN1_XENLA|nr:uncharacterized protein cxcl2.L isoform X2 [Xenopus laevis]